MPDLCRPKFPRNIKYPWRYNHIRHYLRDLITGEYDEQIKMFDMRPFCNRFAIINHQLTFVFPTCLLRYIHVNITFNSSWK